MCKECRVIAVADAVANAAIDAIADAVHMCRCNWISQASHSSLVVMVHGQQETTLSLAVTTVVVLACVERTRLHWFPIGMRHHICCHFLGRTDAQAIK